MQSSFLLISSDTKFISGFKDALSLEIYGLDVCQKPDLSLINKYPLILIYSDSAPLYLYEIRQTCNTPVIVIDNSSTMVYQYLDQGADDYMVMPVNFKELIARCRAVLRRSNASKLESTEEIKHQGLVISKESYDVRIQNAPVSLSSREFEIMFLLASNPNRVLTRDEILNSAFGHEYEGDLRAVDVHIKKIRDKVDNPKNVWSIKTVRGVGYKFSV